MRDVYASFDVPEEMVEEQEEQPGIPAPLRTPRFDFDRMDVALNPNGSVIMVSDHEAYIQWATKCVMTERFENLAYSDDFGVEMEAIIQADYPREIAESEIERTITEALMVDPRTVAVDNFNFEWAGDSAWVAFQAESIYGRDEIRVEIGGA